MAILGFNSLSIAASSTVEWGNTRLRVALALDVTGSMGYDGKLPALQTAAKNLLKQLKTAAIADGDVYVSIVPFAKDVNVGASNYTASWVKWSGSPDTWDETNTTSGTCSNNAYSSQNSCTTQGHTWTPDHSKWNGCVMDREQNYDTTNSAPTSWSTDFPAEQYGHCPASMMGLSYDWTALNDKSTSLTAQGGTTSRSAWPGRSSPSPPPRWRFRQRIRGISIRR